MGDNDLNLALAHAALAGSSGWSLFECKDMKYARVAFGLYLVNGVVGVVEYVLPKSNSKVKKAREFIARVSRPAYLPIIAAEAILFAGFDEKYSYGHLVFPVAYIALTELLKKNIKEDYLDLSTMLNAVSLAFSSYTKDDILYGGITTLLNVVAFMGVQYNSMEYLLVIAVANLGAVQFFKQSLIK